MSLDTAPAKPAEPEVEVTPVPRRDPVAIATRVVIPLLLVVGTFATLARVAAMPLSNFDTYFHLRFGHEFLTGHWSLQHPGSVSTFATKDWVPTQWLPEVVMAQFQNWFGLAGVAWLSGLQLCSLALTLYLVGRRFADPVVVAPLLVITLIADGPGLSMRPQVLSYLLVAVTACLWMRARETAKVPWLLIPLTYVWAMLHGMWPCGLVIGLVAVAGLAADRVVNPRVWLRMLAVPVLSAIACALTPVGPRLYPAVLLVNSRAKYFSEWAPPKFTDPNCLALLVLIAIAALVMLRREKNPWFDIFLLALAGGWAVYSGRTIEVSASIILPLGALTLQRLIRERSTAGRRELGVVIGSYVAALAVLAIAVPSTASEPPPQPSWVDPTLRALPEGTPILEDSGFGGYLMWRFPKLDIVAHGYGDTYTTNELDRNVAIAEIQNNWETFVRQTGARYALLPPTSNLAYALTGFEGWQVTQHSPEVELLEAPADWNQ